MLEIIESVQQTENPTLSNVADNVEVSKSSVYNHLASLVDQGYVIKEDNKYRLSLRFTEIGYKIRQGSELHQEGKHELNKLKNEIEEQVTLVIREGNRGVVQYVTEPENSINSGLHPGSSFPLHCTATGKAILAFLNDETVAKIFDERGLEPLTKYTITDRQLLEEEFVRIREHHFTKSRAERIRGVNSIAVPLLVAQPESHENYQYAEDDHVIQGAISVQLNNNKYRDDDRIERIWKKMDRHKDNICLKLSYS